ncbi:MAG: hypothetical protein KBC17_02255 [Candidatus Pacebacteria bacterium]|nr:hypothetical protein [Candidatus Paceibacterota bacterium]
MKKLIMLTSIIALFFAEIAKAQKPLIFKTKELEKYAPSNTAPSATLITRRYDTNKRLVLEFKHCQDNRVEIYHREYSRSGNLTANTTMLLEKKKDRWKKYILVQYEKRVLKYNSDDYFTREKKFRKVTQEQYSEEMNKVIALLKSQ